MDVHVERQPDHFLGLTSAEWILVVLVSAALTYLVDRITASRRS